MTTDFLISWLKERGVVDLDSVADSGLARVESRAGNLRFINEERCRLRAQLYEAAANGALEAIRR